MIGYVCNSSTGKVEAGGSEEIQSHLQLQSESKASLGYVRPPSQTNKNLRERGRHTIAQAGLTLGILLPQSPKC